MQAHSMAPGGYPHPGSFPPMSGAPVVPIGMMPLGHGGGMSGMMQHPPLPTKVTKAFLISDIQLQDKDYLDHLK